MMPAPSRTNLKAVAAKSAQHRPNPKRSIFIGGEITPSLVEKLTIQVINLCAESREPITVYIDSPGGSVAHSAVLLRLLRATNENGDPPCRIITVVTSYAGSAAADLLAGGDYAIAYPESRIHFHGARTRNDDLTVEAANGVATDLKESNNRSALALARSARERFFFRFFSLRSSFDAYRIANPSKPKTDEDVFLSMISANLSGLGVRVVRKALTRKQRYQSVSDYVMARAPFKKAVDALDRSKPETLKKLEAEMLRAMVIFELKQNRKYKAWTFARSGLSQLGDDFLLLREYIGHHDGLAWLCDVWKNFIITPEEEAIFSAMPPAEAQKSRTLKVAERLMPLWLFFGALCHALQQQENPMTAIDAYWLGLIDEVIGEDFACERKVFEQRPVRSRRSVKGARSARA